MEDKFKLNRQLQQKYLTNENFRNKINDRQKNYELGKVALQNQEDLQIPDEILEVFAFEKEYEIFFYYAYMQPSSKKMTPKLTLFLIKNFEPQQVLQQQNSPDKKYKFVFFNNLVNNNQIYYEFKNIFLTLPIKYFLALDEFIFLKPSFSQKVYQLWTNDEIQKFFKAKTKYVSNTQDLCDLLSTEKSKLVEFLPQTILQQQFPNETKNTVKKQNSFTDYRINLKGQQRSQKQKSQFKSFLQSISSFLTKSNNQPLQLDQYQTNETNLPIILQELFGYFAQNEEKIKQQGLFRKSVSIDEENETLQQLMRNNFQYLKKIKNSHLIASLIKRFFAKLKTPIIPYDSFNRLMHDQGVIDKINLIKQEINSLNSKNYFSLLFLFQFLVQKILPYEKYTKMDTRNLAICFAPCLLRSQKPSQLDLLYATKSSHVVKMILQNFEDIFGNKKQRQQKIRQTVQTSRGKWQLQLKKQIKSLSDQSINQQRQSDYF